MHWAQELLPPEAPCTIAGIVCLATETHVCLLHLNNSPQPVFTVQDDGMVLLLQHAWACLQLARILLLLHWSPPALRSFTCTACERNGQTLDLHQLPDKLLLPQLDRLPLPLPSLRYEFICRNTSHFHQPIVFHIGQQEQQQELHNPPAALLAVVP